MTSFRETTEEMRRSMLLLNGRCEVNSPHLSHLSETEEEYEEEERGNRRRNQVRASNSYEGNQQDSTDVLREIRKDVTDMKNEFLHFKRKVEEQQSEMLDILKKMKFAQEAESFEIGNSPHTDAVNKLLSRYYIQLGRFVKDNAAKKQHLERIFQSSVTGLSNDDLMERVVPFEKKRFSYWRTEERRRVLALSGWEALQASTTRQLTKKVIQLLGQKGNSILEETLFKDLVLVRQYVRQVGLTEARKDQTFWLSYGHWRVEHFHCPTETEWKTLTENDRRIYK